MDTMPQDPPISQSVFFRSSCFEHSGVRLNMDRGHLIDNQTVKFAVSYSVVSKQVEVSTILVSVESTDPWLHAGTCQVLVHYVVLEILHDIIRTHLFILHINQVAYFTESNMEYRYISNYITHKHQTSTSM